ncbi:MAG: hypothetical protein JJ970_06560 [Erythrobacter sp.]|nr:hypothetical protein [Erythrobacter sp.]
MKKFAELFQVYKTHGQQPSFAARTAKMHGIMEVFGLAGLREAGIAKIANGFASTGFGQCGFHNARC